MPYPVWEAGKLYLPGALIQPATATESVPQTLTNAGFESGDTGWTKQTGWTITQAAQTFAGTWSAKFNGGSPASVINNAQITVTPGQTVSATCRVYLTTDSSPSGAQMLIRWYTSANAQISYVRGTVHNSGDGIWKQLSVSGQAPATAAYGKVELSANKSSGQGTIYADSFTVTAPTPAVTTNGLVFKAVQANAGLSGTTEPTWPTVNGNQVIDNQVTWEAVLATRVVWQASPVLESGGVEPTWPTTPGAVVIDGGIAWECRSTHITDTNCPNSKVVAIVSAKVFAADGDIVRFSATANPLDWTTEQDAGYLPTGLQQANANDMAVLNQYRSHLVCMNASSFQMWQVDPDPANMAILDQMDGIGSTYQGAAQSVANELLYLSQQGVRSVGVAGATENMQAGDIGSPIDPIVQGFLDGSPSSALSTYYPGAGQYWLCADAASGGATGMYLTGNAPDTYTGSTYSYTYAATGGVAPITYSITSGALNPGLSLSAAGVITGTPTTEGAQSFTVTATDAGGRTASVADTITVSIITSGLYTISLLHFGGSNGSTTFTDEKGLVWTPANSAQISTTQSKFGGSGGWFNNPAGSSNYVTTPNVDAMVLGEADFTVECFFYISSFTAGYHNAIFSKADASGLATFRVEVLDSGALWLHMRNTAGTAWAISASPTTVVAGQWYHVALVRYGSAVKLFVNGVQYGGDYAFSGAVWDNGEALRIAALLGSNIYYFNGFIDEFRMSKGIARYTANFIPPSAPFVVD